MTKPENEHGEERGPLIVGGSLATRSPPQGSRVIGCELCSAPTLFTPASFERAEADAMFVCIGCAFRLGTPAEIEALLAAEKRELEACGMDPAEAEASTEQLRRALRAPPYEIDAPPLVQAPPALGPRAK